MTTIHRLSAGLLSLTMTLLLLAGCTKERPRSGAESPVAPSEVTEVTFALSTGVETYANGPIPAKGYEKDFVKEDKEQLQMLLFKEDGTFLRIAPFKKPDAAHYGIEIKEKGKYKLIVVANHELQLSDLTGKSLDDVKKMIVKKEPGVPNEFVMASDVKDFEVTSNRLANLGTITLTRLAARIDIQTTLEKLELTKVTVKNRKCESALFASTDTDSRATSTCTEEGKGLYTTFKIFNSTETNTKAIWAQVKTSVGDTAQLYPKDLEHSIQKQLPLRIHNITSYTYESRGHYKLLSPGRHDRLVRGRQYQRSTQHG